MSRVHRLLFAALMSATSLAATAETIGATATGTSSMQWSMGVPYTSMKDPYAPQSGSDSTWWLGAKWAANQPHSASYGQIVETFCRNVRDTDYGGATTPWIYSGGTIAYCATMIPVWQSDPPISAGQCYTTCYPFINPGYGEPPPKEAPGGLSVTVANWLDYACPATGNWTLVGDTCTRPDCDVGFVREPESGQCIPKTKNPGTPPPELCDANPVNTGTGTKSQRQEILDTGVRGLRYDLDFATSLDGAVPVFGNGAGWMNPYERRLLLSRDADLAFAPAIVVARRPAGGLVKFVRLPNITYLADGDVNDRLTRIADSTGRTAYWLYYNVKDSLIEKYRGDSDYLPGELQAVYPASGGGLFVLTQQGRLAGLQDMTSARYIVSTFDARGKVQSSKLAGTMLVTNFLYDGNDNLVEIDWPDLSKRRFLYEDARWPHNLTGIVDENAARYATWYYDGQGRVVNSQHANGADEVSFAYLGATSVATDSFGAGRVRPLAIVNGVTRGTGISQPGGAGCGPSSNALVYDANANVTARDDFAGARACYAYDTARNLETSRVEGLGTSSQCAPVLVAQAALPAGSRKITRAWHPDWGLEIRRAEPKRLTTYVYNGQADPFAGNSVASCAPSTATLPDGKPIVALCKRVEQATTDANGGAGFSAPLQAGVAPRQWTWTYNQDGQVLTATDPRSATTTYSYYAAISPNGDYARGDLASVTNALGHATQFPKYDAFGRTVQTVLPSGATVARAYGPRGWLASETVAAAGGGAAQTTSHLYDGVGQLKQTTLPDGGVVQYRYDDAHRLIGQTGPAGSRVDYVLDSKGNRVTEQVKDSNGSVARSVTRTYDLLNRLETASGAPR